MAASDTIEAEGHLIDSGLLSAIFDKIIEFKASYEIVTFDIGRTNDDPSHIKMRINAAMPQSSTISSSSSRPSAATRSASATPRQAGRKGSLRPGRLLFDDEQPHARARRAARWVEVEQQRMDAVIVVDGRPRVLPQAARRARRRARSSAAMKGSASHPSSRSATASVSRS